MADESPTDEQLVKRLGEGWIEALALLVKRHQRRALHLAYRSLGDWHLAEDVVQESFLRVNRAAPGYRPEARFTTWFHRIVVNLCMDELRKRQRWSQASANAATEIKPGTVDPGNPEMTTELHRAVRLALDRLNEREQLAVILHRFEGYSHRQIAEIMECSLSAVESLLVRAYRKLRRDLAPYAGTFAENPLGQDRSTVKQR